MVNSQFPFFSYEKICEIYFKNYIKKINEEYNIKNIRELNLFKNKSDLEKFDINKIKELNLFGLGK